jgi:hypothetical protein
MSQMSSTELHNSLTVKRSVFLTPHPEHFCALFNITYLEQRPAPGLLTLLAYAGAICAAAFRVAIVCGIIHAGFPLRALDRGNPAAHLLFRFSAFALMLN